MRMHKNWTVLMATAAVIGTLQVGSALAQEEPQAGGVLRILATGEPDHMDPALAGMDLTVRTGEVVGVCGVEGNGQTELAECIMGMRPQTGGRVLLCGENVSRKTPGEIRSRGVSFIPEDRMTTGVDGKASVAENLLVGKQRRPEFSLLGGLHLRRRRVKQYAAEQAELTEEIALTAPTRDFGFGCIGDAPEPLSWQKFLDVLTPHLSTPPRLVGQVPREVRRVAYCPGSGVDLAASAFARGAQVFLTGDVKFHQAQAVMDRGLTMDVGHFSLEESMMRVWSAHLAQALGAEGVRVMFLDGCDPFA